MDGRVRESRPGSVASPNGNAPRVKLLCSFSGSIMPRPQDGILRYVGGETRIVSLHRDINYENLMARMRELYEGAILLKYQQPDEDLDALVSVVNDDDLINMMEEYDKLCWGESFARLRVFLFPNPEHDASLQFIDVDEQDSERRYVDALNNLNDGNDLINHHPHHLHHPVGPSLINQTDEIHIADPFFNQVGFEGTGNVNQTNFEVPISHLHLRNLTIPQKGAGQHLQQSASHNVYSDVDSPWSPAQYSPSLVHGQLSEFSCSPSSVRSHAPYAEIWDRTSEEYTIHHPQQNPEAWLPTGLMSSDKSAYPGNILHGLAVYPEKNPCETRRIPHHGYLDFHWNRVGEELGNGIQARENSYTDKEVYLLNVDPNIHCTFSLEKSECRRSSHHESPHTRNEVPQPIQAFEPPQAPPQFIGDLTNERRVEGMSPGLKKIGEIQGPPVHSPPKSSPYDDGSGLCSGRAADMNAGAIDPFFFCPSEEEKICSQADMKHAGTVIPESRINPPITESVEIVAGTSIDGLKSSRIESTEAEKEAISRGLQTIKNDDLEEIKELGSGTYGSVYHGKWKGSDVAIKRIKASCFDGRPTDRARLIADFWKEALTLSSLHHPNVVAFYGIVRDGPDGSLATVTEFMINGSLKQFLQKKDRTIDRRKRLIIAMDTAFGMEYLHAKNIVHFDLKCENLLVNMRDPHRPVCKIGDLGLSKVKQQTLVSGGVRGTLPWMAPELLSGMTTMVTDKIDVYSFGIVMWELLTGGDPYGGMHCATMIGRIVNSALRPEIPTWCDPEWKALMESCWAGDPSDRPPFSDISHKLRTIAAASNVK